MRNLSLQKGMSIVWGHRVGRSRPSQSTCFLAPRELRTQTGQEAGQRSSFLSLRQLAARWKLLPLTTLSSEEDITAGKLFRKTVSKDKLCSLIPPFWSLCFRFAEAVSGFCHIFSIHPVILKHFHVHDLIQLRASMQNRQKRYKNDHHEGWGNRHRMNLKQASLQQKSLCLWLWKYWC